MLVLYGFLNYTSLFILEFCLFFQKFTLQLTTVLLYPKIFWVQQYSRKTKSEFLKKRGKIVGWVLERDVVDETKIY